MIKNCLLFLKSITVYLFNTIEHYAGIGFTLSLALYHYNYQWYIVISLWVSNGDDSDDSDYIMT